MPSVMIFSSNFAASLATPLFARHAIQMNLKRRVSPTTQINDLVKRTRFVKVHSLIIGYLKAQMPSFFGTKAKQDELLANMNDVFLAIHRDYRIPTGASQ